MTAKDLEQLERWRSKLWSKALAAAPGKQGRAVVNALHRATIKLNDLGMDELYDEVSQARSTEGLYFAFDITWLAGFVLELEHLPKSKRK